MYQTKMTPSKGVIDLVRLTRFELARILPHKSLNLTRLPIPPQPRAILILYLEDVFCQGYKKTSVKTRLTI